MSEGTREGPFVVALDIGTSRIKGALVGRELALFDDPTVRLTPSDPDGLVEAVAEILDVLVSSCPRPPSAVAISCYWHGLLLVDRQTRPLGAITTWQDTRDGQGAQRLRETIDPAQYHAKTGCFIHPSYPMTRIFMAQFAPVRGDAARMVGPGEWIIMELLGECMTSSSMASGTGLTRIGGDEYDPEVLDVVGVGDAELPRISHGPLTGLRSPWSDRWPDLEDVPWFLPVGDGAAASVGSGCDTRGRVALSMGTSGAARCLSEPLDVAPEELFVYSAGSGRHLIGGATSNAGNLLRWSREVLRLPEDAVDAALSRSWGSHLLHVAPNLAGQRSPHWPAEATGAIGGLRLETSALDLLQALIEAATDDIVAVVRSVDRWLGAESVLVASGGVIERQPAWASALARRIGREIHRSSASHPGLTGAALLALEQLGMPCPVPPVGEVIS